MRGLNYSKLVLRPVLSGGRGGHAPPPVFGRTVNPISTRGTDYAHHSTECPTGFSDLATALVLNVQTDYSDFQIINLLSFRTFKGPLFHN